MGYSRKASVFKDLIYLTLIWIQLPAAGSRFADSICAKALAHLHNRLVRLHTTQIRRDSNRFGNNLPAQVLWERGVSGSMLP
jgi:hypothetical protein